MRSRLFIVALVGLVMTACAPATLAQCTLSFPSQYTGTTTIGILFCPRGDGTSLGQAWYVTPPPIPPAPRPTADATITATLLDGGVPIVNYPFEDVWLEFEGACNCGGGATSILSDAGSDANGEVTFSGSPSGGGCATSPIINLYLAGVLCATGPTNLNFKFVSVDINCDGIVDGLDATALTPLYLSHDPCADLNLDGKWTTADPAVMAAHRFNGNPPHECQ